MLAGYLYTKRKIIYYGVPAVGDAGVDALVVRAGVEEE